MDTFLKKYKEKQRSTIGRIDKNGDPIEFRLTFEQFSSLWKDAGLVPGYPYVISRKNDIGHYEIGNVFIQHNIQNITDSHGLNSNLDKKINE